MRFHYFLLLVLLAGCPPQAPGAGTEGHPCRTGFAANWACNDGLRCMNEGCVSCGKVGEICCFQSGSEICNAGIACEGGNDWTEGAGSCTADCGLIGLACCDGTCPGSGECVGGTCEAPVGDPCFSGRYPHVVYVVAADCQFAPVALMTDTVEQAEACREQLVAAASPGQEICPLDKEPEYTEVCKDSAATGYSTLQFATCSTAQLTVCEQYNCAVDCTWTDGACP